jgi:2-octaprenyl-6-methoxyphenol hydroxylase
MALASANSGFSVCIIDAISAKTQKYPDFDGRSYAIAMASGRMLKALGLWEDLEAGAQPILDIKVTDGAVAEHPSPFFLHFDKYGLDEGPMGNMVEDRHLRSVLQSRLLDNENVKYLGGRRVEGQATQTTSSVLTLDDGGKVHASLVICADGRNSASAKIAGITYNGWKYTQSALVCALEHEYSLNGFAYQHFMPSGPLAILPLKDNRCSIVWTETAENARAITTMDNDAYLDVLKPRFGDFLGEIKLVGKRFFYPLDMSIAKSFIAERVAVIGDAAHGMHPIAGQGLNAGMRDIAALSQLCKEAKERGEDFGSQAVLTRYQEWRRFDATALTLTMDVLNRLFSNDSSLLRNLRTIGMGVVNRFPSAKRTFTREAAGVTGNLPDLMR